MLHPNPFSFCICFCFTLLPLPSPFSEPKEQSLSKSNPHPLTFVPFATLFSMLQLDSIRYAHFKNQTTKSNLPRRSSELHNSKGMNRLWRRFCVGGRSRVVLSELQPVENQEVRNRARLKNLQVEVRELDKQKGP